jgi:hypothetical protein
MANDKPTNKSERTGRGPAAYNRRLLRDPLARPLVMSHPEAYADLGICVEPRCNICKLSGSNPELYRYINARMLDGTRHQDIVDHAAAEGFKTSSYQLGRHRPHLMHFVEPALLQHMQITALAASIGDVQNYNISVIISRIVCVLVLPMIARLSETHLAKLSPEGLINLALKASTVNSRNEATDANTRLRHIELQLQQLRMSESERQLMARAISELRSALQGNTDLWSQVEPLLQQAAELADLAQLPAGGHDE